MSDEIKPEEAETPGTKKSSTRKPARKATKKETSLAPWKFPKNTLEETLQVAKALDEKFAGNPTKADELVKAVGFNKETDWRFLNLLRSAALYGITSGSGETATVRLEKSGEDIVSPESSEQRLTCLLTLYQPSSEFSDHIRLRRRRSVAQ